MHTGTMVALFLLLLPLLGWVIASPIALEDIEPIPPFSSVPEKENVVRNFVSATLGSNMVLQRDTQAILWGYTHRGATVTTSLRNGMEEEEALLMLTTTASKIDGLWRQTLPPQPASMKPHSLKVSSNTGETQVLKNVLFGDIYLCGGQSNMVFSLPGNTNGTEEAQRGDDYQHIRVFTVGQGTQSETPMPDLQTVEQEWSVAGTNSLWEYSANSEGGGTYWFSSVCWFFGREISEGLDNKVPIGLISNNWGGTGVQRWNPKGNLYNAMIHPYLVGPMKLTGFAWYQGEANAGGQKRADQYAKNFPSLIQSWREGFQIPEAYFGFVQLSTWCAGLSVPELRQAQMAALKLNGKIGYATNADHGDGCNIHPPDKQYCGARLGRSALALQYGKDIQWKSPSYAGASSVLESKANTPTIVIELKDVSSKGLYLLEVPYNLKPAQSSFSCDKHSAGTCEGASVLVNGKGWVNATISIKDNHVVFTAAKGDPNDSIVASSYGWGAVPLMTLYDAETDLPVLPWKEEL